MSIEAMKQALEALEECRRDPRLKYEHSFYDKTITALRTAIAEAERHQAWNSSDTAYRSGGLPQDFIGHESENQEPVAYAVVGDGQWGEWLIGDQFETSKPPKHKYWENRGYELVPLYTPLAAQQEPVVCKHKFVMDDEAPSHACCQLCGEVRTASTPPTPPTPPAAQWVGFTEAEINEWDYDTRDLVMDIEKLLREKNT